MTNAEKELNGWRELGEELGRVVSLMPTEVFEDWFPDWFGSRLFDLQVMKALPVSEELPVSADPKGFQNDEGRDRSGERDGSGNATDDPGREDRSDRGEERLRGRADRRGVGLPRSDSDRTEEAEVAPLSRPAPRAGKEPT